MTTTRRTLPAGSLISDRYPVIAAVFRARGSR